MSDRKTETANRILALIDLTSLGESDNDQTICDLCDSASTRFGSVAAVCIWPKFVKLALQQLAGTIPIATVANFPGGDASLADVESGIARAVAHGADEIDVVMPYNAWLAGKREETRAFLSACKRACGDKALFKVILETGALETPQNIGNAAKDAIAAGADFLKTSTGKIEISATLDAVEALMNVVAEHIEQGGRSIGIKVSGGIRTLAQANNYLQLADRILGPEWARPETFRFGTSKLLDDVIGVLAEGEKCQMETN